ncbi:MAG: His-Xaa-Ser system protein HxsD [Bryobacteraceae bacterium]
MFFDSSLYRSSAVQKAAYKFSDRCFLKIDPAQGGCVVGVSLRSDCSEPIDTILGEFANEVLDQELREKVGQETEAIRNLIIAHAFSKSALIDPGLDSCGYQTDPLGIMTVPEHSNPSVSEDAE